MDTTATSPKKRPAEKRRGPESTKGKRPGERQPPAAAEITHDEPPTSTDERDERKPTPSAPITNKDEQDRITNAGDQDRPVAER